MTEYLRKGWAKNTDKRYRAGERKWKEFMEENGEGTNIFMQGWGLKKKRKMLVRFVRHLDERKHEKATEVAVTMAGVRHCFVINSHSVKAFADETVLAARRVAWTAGAREIQIQRERSTPLPVTVDMVNKGRELEWGSGEIDRMMSYVGIVLAFNFMLRASEYIMDNKCGEHYIMTDDVIYNGTDDRRSWRAWELEGVDKTVVGSITFVVRTSKSKKPKTLYLGRGTGTESQAVDDLVDWAQKAALTPGDPFTSRHKGGRRKKLTRKMVKEALRRVAGEMGLGKLTFAFNTRSLRIGGAASMTAAGEDRSLVKRIGGWSKDSEVDMVYYRNSHHDKRALAMDAVKNTLRAGDIQRLVTPALRGQVSGRQ